MTRATLIRFVDLKAQHAEIRQELDAAIADVVDSGQFILGPQVEAFEKEFASQCGAAFAAGTNSGTSALHLALLAAGVGPGDEVITVSLTFAATVAAILYVGATPVLVDVDPRTCNLDPAAIEAAVTSKTKAVMPVHLYGQCADMDAIRQVTDSYRLALIEDAAQAAGARYKGRPAGSLGDIGCFSFYPAKNLGALGEAGAVVTDNAAHAAYIKTLRDHGQSRKYSHDMVGYNYRMEAIQGAVLRVKLKRLEAWNQVRRMLAASYRQRLEGVELLPETHDAEPNFHIFPILSPRRDALREHLAQRGIETGIHYPIPVHLQPAYARAGIRHDALPHTERLSRQILSLPMHPHLTTDDVAQVAAAITEFAVRNVS